MPENQSHWRLIMCVEGNLQTLADAWLDLQLDPDWLRDAIQAGLVHALVVDDRIFFNRHQLRDDLAELAAGRPI